MYFKREIQPQINIALARKKAVILYGARQVGKTTLVKKIMAEYPKKSLLLNCDEPDIREILTEKTSTELKQLVGDNRMVVIDEAQRVRNIGLTLKLMVDNIPDLRIIATGSSSFELANKVKEPLTGRKVEFYLYPISITELSQAYSDLEISRLTENMLQFGLYPEVVTSPVREKAQTINEIAGSYLYRDVLEYGAIKKPEVLERLLQALALQIGNEVSFRELAGLIGIDKITVEKYIHLLEKAFIIFPLRPFSRNVRNEIGKKRKIYFYDVGIRNSIIRNFNPIHLRNDTGVLWENFLISERIKTARSSGKQASWYFWRTYDKKEIDFVEEMQGKIRGYEIKWGNGKLKRYKDFLEGYPGCSLELVNKNNFLSFVAKKD